MEKFFEAFENNFYLTNEWANFCSAVSHLPLQNKILREYLVRLIKDKNIAIHNYSEAEHRAMRSQKISYISVLTEINSIPGKQSYIEYPIFFKTSYTEASKNYKTSFSNGLREGKKFPHKTKVIRNPDKETIRKVYWIYTLQMRRLNSFVFPEYFFDEFFECPSSLLLLVENKEGLLGYFCCFQFCDNIYSSIGGGNPEFFSYKCSNKLYDELIKYACENSLNIHMGIGVAGSGYEKFKHNAGAISFKLESFPGSDALFKTWAVLQRFEFTGLSLRILSKMFPKFLLYEAMPFT